MKPKRISHRQRIEACLSNNPIDRVPVSLWRHFPVDDQYPERFAEAIVSFQKTFDFDLVKVTPASSYCLKDWGVDDVWRGSIEGTREYSHHVINHPDDWYKISVLDPYQGFLGNQLRSLKIVINKLGSDSPIIQTVFSPLSQAKNLVGGTNLLIHLRRFPEALHAGLCTIAKTTRLFINALQDVGIDGIFFAVQHAQHGILSVEEYNTFGRAYDLQVLDPARKMRLNMLHLHGMEIMYNQLIDYPVNIINWHDRDTCPSLQDGLSLFPGVVCGGLQRQRTLVLGTPDDVKAEAREAIRATQGQRFILGTGCVVPIIAPYGNIMAARQCAELNS
jgi:uroporphyrinogen decarboxylase